MYKAKVYITLRKSILDPKGKATLHALHSLGYNSIQEARIGKYIELNVEAANEDEANQLVKEASEKLLANMVMEDFTFELEKI
ncbi:phosphoribosylformylglycinamidine synthase subunit PurS [bacterium]|nr:MAG: phosphoribosylformylglycinamidine synthase subunit PurS [bacterium]